MAKHHFSHVRHWVFDLDNTLYPPHARLFDQIEVRMTDYVQAALGVDRAEADRLRLHYWTTYGTTLAGLMREHGTDPGPYLHEVHDIDLDHLDEDDDLARAIDRLPGQKIVYTNGSAPYAMRVLAARGLGDVFEGIFGVEHAGFHPKPDRAAFEIVFAAAGVVGTAGAMFEDDARNLKVPSEMGLRTVLVAPQTETPPDHVDHHTDDLGGFLSQLI